MAKRDSEKRIRGILDRMEENDRVRMQMTAKLVEMAKAKPELLQPEIRAMIQARTEAVRESAKDWEEFILEVRGEPNIPADIVARIEAHRDRAKWLIGQMEAIQ